MRNGMMHLAYRHTHNAHPQRYLSPYAHRCRTAHTHTHTHMHRRNRFNVINVEQSQNAGTLASTQQFQQQKAEAEDVYVGAVSAKDGPKVRPIYEDIAIPSKWRRWAHHTIERWCWPIRKWRLWHGNDTYVCQLFAWEMSFSHLRCTTWNIKWALELNELQCIWNVIRFLTDRWCCLEIKWYSLNCSHLFASKLRRMLFL